MRRVYLAGCWAGAAMMLLAAAPAASIAPIASVAPVVTSVPTGPVTLSSQPGTPLDVTARRVAAADLADGDAKTLVLIGSQRLGSAGTGPALFVQVQSVRSCGSAGCSVSVYLPFATGWTKVLDAVSGQIVVAPTEHHGMHDLLVGRSDRWVWNGRIYTDTLPAPQVDLRPRKHPTKALPHHT